MATVEEIEKYCRNCVSRDFVNGKGLVCKRTRELPDFDEECENFEKDEELLKMAVCIRRVYLGGGGMESYLRFYRSSDGIYGYRSRIPGRFRHAAGEGDTSRLRYFGSGTGIDQLCVG